jgi:fucose 4-O-acetylase-like acetyltransferase
MHKIIWVDLMKGIGILAVVAGHVYTGVATNFIYLFHMPLFFFLSGYLFKSRTDFKLFLRDKSIHLLLPYFCFLIPIYVVFNPLSFSHSNANDLFEFILKPIIGGRILTGALSVFWFVTCLFFVQQLMNVMLVKLNENTVIVISILMLCLAYINSVYFPDYWLPWNANVVLAALPFFYIGYLYKTNNFNLNKIILLLAAIIAIASVLHLHNNFYDMKHNFYGIPFVTFIASVIIILSIQYFSTILSQIAIISKPLIELGKASMVIMFTHQPIQIIIKRFVTSDLTVRFLASVIFSYLLYLLLSRFAISRALFMGSKTDFDTIILRKNNS